MKATFALWQLCEPDGNYIMLFRTILVTELICLVVIIFTNPVFSSSSAEITVAFSKRDPFVVRNQYGELGGLDILIINNFARKVHLNVKYMEQNSSLNEILENQEFSEKCLARVNSQWVLLRIFLIHFLPFFTLIKWICFIKYILICFQKNRHFNRCIRWSFVNEWTFHSLACVLLWRINVVCSNKEPNSKLEKYPLFV